jgi:hypothetical protein
MKQQHVSKSRYYRVVEEEEGTRGEEEQQQQQPAWLTQSTASAPVTKRMAARGSFSGYFTSS